MTNFRSRVSALSTDLPSRDVGSRGEELASEALADELYNLGLQTDIDGFTCPGNLRVSRSVYYAFEFLAALICLFAPGLRILALILALAGFVLLYLSYSRVDPFGSLISKYESQNVVARYVPQGLSQSSRRGKVIITAYYDVQKPSLFQMPAIRRFYPIVRQVVMYAALAVPVCVLISMFPFPEIISKIFAVIAFIGGIVMLIAIIDQLIGAFLKTPKGANSNASGLAVMTALAEKIVTAEVRAPEPVEFEDDDRGRGRDRGRDRDGRSGRRGRSQRSHREEPDANEFDEPTDDLMTDDDEAPRSQRPRKQGRYDSEMARAAAIAQERAEASDASKNATAPIPVEETAGAPAAPTAEPAQTPAPDEPASSVAPAPAAPEAVAPAASEAKPAPVAEKAALKASPAAPAPEPVKAAEPAKAAPSTSAPAAALAAAAGVAAASSVASSAAKQAPAQSRAAQQAAAPAKKMPSWWSKVEDEKDRGEFSGGEHGETTLRSRFADAPAYHEFTSPVPEPKPAPAPEPAPVVQVAPEPAPIVQVAPEPAPVVQAAPEPAPVVPAAPAPEPAPAPVASPVEAQPEPALFDPNSTVAYKPEPVTEEVVEKAEAVKAEAAKAESVDTGAAPVAGPAAGAVPEPAPASGSDAYVAPVFESFAGAASEPAPAAEEPLLEPEQEPDWPSGSYKYSRNLYASSDSDRSSDAVDQPDISDYSRTNYMYDPDHDYSELEAAELASPDRTLASEEIPSWLDAANATADLANIPSKQAPETAFEPDLDTWEDPGYQPPRASSGTTTPSLLDLPVVGSLDANVSMGDGATQRGLDLSTPSANDSFITRADVQQSSNNLTGSFAPLGATGTMAPVTSEMLEQYNSGDDLYLDEVDVDDSSYENQFTDEGSYVGAMPVEMPKKSRFSLFKRGGKKKSRRGETEESASEWLGLDEQFDARTEGANIGSWDNFDEGDSDWRGGAYGGKSHERNRDAIAALSDDLLNKEVWFVALGASGAGSYGMRNLLRTRSSDVKHSRIINLESIGAGDLFYTTSESVLFKRKGIDPRLHKLVQKASRASRVAIDPIDLTWKSTEATPAIEKGVRAITITSMDGGTIPGWRWKDDTEEIVEPRNLEDAYRLLIELIKAV